MAQRRVVRRPTGRKSKGSGGGFFLLVIVVAVVIAANNKGGDPQPNAAPANSDPRQLAAQVLQLPADIVMGGASRAALDTYAKTGIVTNFCGDKLSEVDPLLLQNLLKLQNDGYRVLINNFGIGNDRNRSLCYDKYGNRAHDQHMLARAVDLNGIVKKGGAQTSWGGIRFRPGTEMKAIQNYADAWLALLPLNRGGVGQEGCFNGRWQPDGFHVTIPPGSANPFLASFTDTCDHLHLDVRIR